VLRDSKARCATHDLALGPSGECVLCRRSLAPPTSTPSPFPFVAIGMGSVVLVLVAMGASHWLRAPVPVSMPAPSVTVEAIAAPPSRPPPSVARPPATRTPSSASLLREPQGSREVPAAVAPASPRTEPSDAALAAARARVSITMYSTSWCGVCAHARGYLDAHHVHYTEHDVEESERYARQMHALNPAGGVPTFDIDGEVLVGFGEARFDQMVDEAARAHVR
jgi:glutaredoxin